MPEDIPSANPSCVSPYIGIEEDDFVEEYDKLKKLIGEFGHDVLRHLNIQPDDFEINEIALRDIIERVHKRKHYYAVFHGISVDKISQHKVMALYIYWIIKLRPIISKRPPIQYDDSYDMNDSFSLYLFDIQIYILDPNYRKDDCWSECLKEILYSFRYRDLSKESIILMFEPFVAAKKRIMKK